MRLVAIRIVAGGQAPAGGTIALVSIGIGNAVSAIDLHVSHILLPVIGVAIFEAARTQTEKGIVRKDKGPAVGDAERQLDAVVTPAVEIVPARGVAARI